MMERENILFKAEERFGSSLVHVGHKLLNSEGRYHSFWDFVL